MIDIIRDYGLLLLIGQYPHGPLGGLVMTIIIAFLGLLMSFPLAILLAVGRVSSVALVSRPIALVIGIVRGTPLLMLIFWAYFIVPKLTGQSVSGFWTLVCALVIYQAAYLAEIIRSGIESLSSGQTEASRALGATPWQTMRHVILPQALVNVIPSLTNQVISTVKETSLGYIISVNELTFAVNQVNNMVLTKPLQVFSILAITYFVINFSLSKALRQLDGRIRAARMMAAG